MYDEFLYKRLSELRLAKGVSARDMSLSIGQSEGYINTIENKKALPSMMGFFYICEYLDISPKDFFDDSIGHPTLINELINTVNQFTDKQIKQIIDLLKSFE